MVFWTGDLFNSNSSDHPARINDFAEHSVTVKDEVFTHLLFSASWYKHHPDGNYFGRPVTVWNSDTFECPGCHSTIPIQLIKARTVSLIYKLNGESVLLVPCIRFLAFTCTHLKNIKCLTFHL